MKKDHQAMIALILIPLYMLTVLNFVRPVRAVSEDENRTLQQLPSFSWESLANGHLTRSFETFYSDQFPFRSFFINVSKTLETWMKKPLSGSVQLVEGPGDQIDLGEGERLDFDPEDKVYLTPAPTPTGQPTVSPTSQATGPKPTPTALPTLHVKPTRTPTPTPRPTPGIDAPVEKISGVIIVENRAMELYYYSETRSERYVSLVNRLQGKLDSAQVYSLIAPTAVQFYSPEEYHDASSNQEAAIADIYSRLDERVRTVDAYSEIITQWQDYIYFRTDHHWTARGAHCAYRAFAQRAGLTPYALDAFESGIVPGDFLGSLYRYTKSSKLKNNPDFVEYFLPLVSSEGIAFTDTKMTEGYRIEAVRTTVNSTNKYLAFIQGDNPLIHLKTDLDNGKRIVVLKESFGNALVPFLLNHYEDVYVIDPRSLKADLPGFIEQHGIQDVLIINYAFAVTNTKWLDGFESMIG